MLLSKGMLGLRAVASQEKTRYAMNGILLHRKPDGTAVAVATNGKMLARVAIDGVTSDNPQDFPEVGEGFSPADLPTGKSLFIVLPNENAAALEKALPKGKKGRPILRHAAIDERLTDGGKLRACVTDLNVTNISSITPVDGHFPPYEEILPSPGKHGVRLTINANLLATLANALHAAAQTSGGDDGVVTLEMRDAMSALIVTVPGRSASQAMGVLMPINSENNSAGAFVFQDGIVDGTSADFAHAGTVPPPPPPPVTCGACASVGMNVGTGARTHAPGCTKGE